MVSCTHGNIRDTSSGLPVGDRNRWFRVFLIGRNFKYLADPTSSRPTAAARRVSVKWFTIIPDHVHASINLRSTAGQYQVIGCGMANMNLVIPLGGGQGGRA